MFKTHITKFILMVITFSSTLSPSFSKAEQKTDWDHLVEQIISNGKNENTSFGEFRTLTRSSTEDLSSPHLIRYLSVIGGSSAEDSQKQSTFTIGHVELVWENWLIDADQNWNVDQWLFKVSAEGIPTKTWHYHLVIVPENGHVLKHEAIQETPNTQQKAWNDRIAEWL